MSKLKLTEEQLKKAAAVASDTYGRSDATWYDAVRAAAPFLQALIADPSKEESIRLAVSVNQAPLAVFSVANAENALRLFVGLRNAALTAKPDPRREAVVKICAQHYSIDGPPDAIADKILAALDGVK
jgi:hypothetical protein